MEWIRRLTLIGALILIGDAKGQMETLTWFGDTASWDLEDTVATLQALGPGSSELRWCFTDLESQETGMDFTFRWIQDLAGSNANFSTITAYHFFPDSAMAFELRLGTTGAFDPISATFWADGAPQSESHQPGIWANGMDANLRWLKAPGAPSGQLLIKPHGAPVYTNLFTGDGNPQCIQIEAHFTSSHVQDFGLHVSMHSTFQSDTIPPKLLNSAWTDDSTLVMQFDEPLGAVPSVLWNGNLGAFCTFSSPSTPLGRSCVFCHPPPPGLPPGKPIHWTANGITDTLGNAHVEPFISSTLWMPPNCEQPGDVIITEIMADPTPSQGLHASEWVEWTNRSERFVDLNQLRWRDEQGHSELAALEGWNGILAPGERCIISSDPVTLAAGVRQAKVLTGGGLADAGERIAVERADGTILDVVNYKSSWWQGATGGISIGLTKMGACGIASHWSPQNPASPGWGDELPEEEGTVNIAAFTPLDQENGILQFDAALSPEHFGTMSWGNTENEVHLQVVDSIRARWVGSIPSGIELRLQVNGLRSCSSPWQRHPPILHVDSVAQFPAAGDLAVTELAVRPPSGWPLHPAFVEWTNISTSPLEISGVQLNEEVQSTRRLQPGESVVHSIDLPNATGQVLLQNHAGEVLDLFTYSNCWQPNRALEDEGWSWVRKDVFGPSRDFRNWQPSQAPLGCSPGWLEQSTPWVDAEQPQHEAWVIHEGNAYMWFSEPVEPSAPNHLLAFPLESLSFATGRAWSWPEGIGMVSVVDHAGNQLNLEYAPPAADQSANWKLSECLSWVEPSEEPFLETWSAGSSWASSKSWVWSSIENPSPTDWDPISDFEWLVPVGSEVAWARCPQRIGAPGSIVLPADLPSLFGDRLISLSRVSDGQRIELDSVWSARNRFDPHDQLEPGTSWERIDYHSSAWGACLEGSTPGAKNSVSFHHLATSTEHGLSVSPQTCIPFQPNWSEISIRWMPDSDQILDRIDVFSLDGELVRTVVQGASAYSISSASRYFWNGTDRRDLPVAPGPYWIVAQGIDGILLDKQVVAVAPRTD